MLSQRFKKLSYKVAFPFDLEIGNIAGDVPEEDRRYCLFAVIVHVGSGPNHGHYVALVRSHSHWLCFDDDAVDVVEEVWRVVWEVWRVVWLCVGDGGLCGRRGGLYCR